MRDGNDAKGKTENMKKTPRKVLTVVLAAVLVISAAQLVRYGLAYKKADEIYAESRTQYVQTPAASPSGSDTGYPAIAVDVAGLQKANPDVVGWIYVPDTVVSYPLVRGSDNEKYLHESYDGQTTASGSIFMDCRSSAALTDDNTVIYGHNMKNGSMFGGLKKYADSTYLRAHPYVYLYLADRVLRYRVFAACKTESDSESYTLKFGDGVDFNGFLQYIEKSAGGNVSELPDTPAPLLTLSTCTSTTETGRFTVLAVRENESKTG